MPPDESPPSQHPPRRPPPQRTIHAWLLPLLWLYPAVLASGIAALSQAYALPAYFARTMPAAGWLGIAGPSGLAVDALVGIVLALMVGLAFDRLRMPLWVYGLYALFAGVITLLLPLPQLPPALRNVLPVMLCWFLYATVALFALLGALFGPRPAAS